MQTKQKSYKGLIYILLVLLSLFMLVPFYWMVISSLKLNKDVFSIPMKWWPDSIHWNNYQIIWKKASAYDFLLKYCEADNLYHRNPAVHQLSCGLRLHKDEIQGKRLDIPDVCYHHCSSVAGIHDSSVHSDLQDGLK